MVSPYEEDGLIIHILLYHSVPVISSLFLPKHCPPAGLWPLRGITNYLESTALTTAAEFSQVRQEQGKDCYSSLSMRGLYTLNFSALNTKCVLETFHVVSASYCFHCSILQAAQEELSSQPLPVSIQHIPQSTFSTTHLLLLSSPDTKCVQYAVFRFYLKKKKGCPGKTFHYTFHKQERHKTSCQVTNKTSNYLLFYLYLSIPARTIRSW